MDARVNDAVREPVERLRQDEADLDRAVAEARRQAAGRVEEARREAEAIVAAARRDAAQAAERLRDEAAAAIDALEAAAQEQRAREVAEIGRRAALHQERALALVVRHALGEAP